MEKTGINWCHHTANFWWGCQRVSAGCEHCYAETLAVQRHKLPIWGPPATTRRERKKGILQDILKWDKTARSWNVRRRVDGSSMSDFLEAHPMVTEWRNEAVAIIEQLTNLDVMMLTKRPENAVKFLPRWMDNRESWPAHVWFGTSVENQKAVRRIGYMLDVPATIHLVSAEPLLERVDLQLPKGADFHRRVMVIAGGETGVGARPMQWDWARSLRDQCAEANIAFWMKQGGGVRDHRDRLEDLPADLRIRELPEYPFEVSGKAEQ